MTFVYEGGFSNEEKLLKQTFDTPAGILRKYTDSSFELDTSEIDGLKVSQAVDTILNIEKINTPFGVVKKVEFDGITVCYDENMLPFKLPDGKLLFDIGEKEETIFGDFWEVKVEGIGECYLDEKGDIFEVNGETVIQIYSISVSLWGELQNLKTKDGNNYYLDDQGKIFRVHKEIVVSIYPINGSIGKVKAKDGNSYYLDKYKNIFEVNGKTLIKYCGMMSTRYFGIFFKFIDEDGNEIYLSKNGEIFQTNGEYIIEIGKERNPTFGAFLTVKTSKLNTYCIDTHRIILEAKRRGNSEGKKLKDSFSRLETEFGTFYGFYDQNDNKVCLDEEGYIFEIGGKLAKEPLSEVETGIGTIYGFKLEDDSQICLNEKGTIFTLEGNVIREILETIDTKMGTITSVVDEHNEKYSFYENGKILKLNGSKILFTGDGVRTEHMEYYRITTQDKIILYIDECKRLYDPGEIEKLLNHGDYKPKENYAQQKLLT